VVQEAPQAGPPGPSEGQAATEPVAEARTGRRSRALAAHAAGNTRAADNYAGRHGPNSRCAPGEALRTRRQQLKVEAEQLQADWHDSQQLRERDRARLRAAKSADALASD
jgi:hypothetical protein